MTILAPVDSFQPGDAPAPVKASLTSLRRPSSPSATSLPVDESTGLRISSFLQVYDLITFKVIFFLAYLPW